MWGWKKKERAPERLVAARGPRGGRDYLVKWVGGKESEKTWEKAGALPPEMVGAFEDATDAPCVITRVVRGGAGGKVVVETSHGTTRLVAESGVPADALAAWKRGVLKKKEELSKRKKIP